MSFLLGALALAAPLRAQESSAAFQVRADVILVGDGTRLENGILVVERGRISRIGKGEVDERMPLVEHAGVLAPGFVACQAESGEMGEGFEPNRSTLPEARLVHGFRPGHSDFAAATRAGVTTMVLTPTGDDLVGGLTCVVKTDRGEIVSSEGHLALSFAGSALSQTPGGGPQFPFRTTDEPDAAVGSDSLGGAEDTDRASRGSRPPTSYSGALRELGDLFTRPQGVYARAARGELPVFLEAWDRNEVVRAAEFAREHRLAGAIRGAPLAGDADVIAVIAESGLGVVLGPYSTGQRRRSLASLGLLQSRGIPVGFAVGSRDRSPEGLRLSAALALSAGATREGALRALTLDAATIAGVDERVGSLARGKDADFVLWSGDPLDLSSRVESVWIGGHKVHSAPELPAKPERSRP
jgi:imidazolonepropionase-like amidohydrolase